MPKLPPVGRETEPAPDYEPIRIPVIGHAIADRAEVEEIFEFRATVNMGAALVLQRAIREAGNVLTYQAAFGYLEQSMLPGEFEKFEAFISRPDVEVHAKTIVDLQQQLAQEYLRDRPTPRASSTGRSPAKRTSGAGSRAKGSRSTGSRSR